MSAPRQRLARWTWFWHRFRCMTRAELLHRVRQAALAPWRQHRAAEAVPAPQWQEGAQWVLTPAVDPQPYLDEAARIAAGSVRLFEQERFNVGVSPDWLQCPLTQVRSPLLPQRRLHISDRKQVGDIKYLWELNRHLHWVTLAQAWALAADDSLLELLRTQLAGWLQQNPAGLGVNANSSLEAGIRLLNWSVVWQLCGGAEGPLLRGHEALRLQWVQAIYRHINGIARHYSRHSSANNHLVGELCGVYVASRCWPFWPQVVELGTQARLELIEQAALQIHSDGVPAEQAFAYAGNLFDYFFVAERCAAAAQEPMPAPYGERLDALAGFAQALLGGSGQAPPAVGDADGGEVLCLDPRGGPEPLLLLAQAHAAWRGVPVPESWPHVAPDRLAWLGLPPPPRASASYLPAARMDFPLGGYHLFGSQTGQADEIQGGIDVGPLGYLGIAAHGHADALQVWLTLGGLPLLIDPGTYAYWAEPAWRDYFRGTRAHNTLCVLGRDQSQSGGRFMWSRHAKTRLLALDRSPEGRLHLRAQTDAYAPLFHERTLSFDQVLWRVIVTDRLPAPAPAALHWHLAPGWQVRLEGDSLHAHQGRWRVLFHVEADGPGELSLVQGQTEPPLGWCSKAYGHKEPSPCLRWQGTAQQWKTTVEIRTLSA